MQTTTAAFTAEQKDKTRSIANSLEVSWKREDLSLGRIFTIGVSSIGGPDSIAGPSGIESRWQQYRYFDETDNVLELEWERQYNFPLGGVSTALASGVLNNTSGRYSPRYAGGDSELFTAVLPRRPVVINAGFYYNGIDNTIPQYVGLFSKQPVINQSRKTVSWQAYDFVDYLANKQVDQTVMFTSQRSDVVIEDSLQRLGFSTAQYELDEGRQTIGFGLFEKGTTWLNHINEIVQAEQGQLYQDEEGIIRFENRVHLNEFNSDTLRTIYTAQIIDAEVPDDDHIINMVEIRAQVRTKQPNQLVFEISSAIELQASTTTEFFVDFEDPMLSIDTPVYIANTASDNSGTDVTTSVTIQSVDEFAKSAKFIFNNATAATAYITELSISGRPAKVSEEVYVRDQISSSVTAYDERITKIENDYIQSESQAQTLATTILLDYATPTKLQKIVILANPDLQLGDRVAWQGHDWNIHSIATKLDPGSGFIQELGLIQRTELSLFTIGVSLIGGGDVIAP